MPKKPKMWGFFLGNTWIDRDPGLDWDACIYAVTDGGAWAGTVECSGNAGLFDFACAVEKLEDNAFFLAGPKGGDLWWVKTDSSSQGERDETCGKGTAYAVRSIDDGNGWADGNIGTTWEDPYRAPAPWRTGTSGNKNVEFGPSFHRGPEHPGISFSPFLRTLNFYLEDLCRAGSFRHARSR